MKLSYWWRVLLMVAPLIGHVAGVVAQHQAMERNIDSDWLFSLTDVSGAERPDFPDHDWRRINLPHDYSIEQGFDSTNASGWRAGYTKGGIAWYRKHFSGRGLSNKVVSVIFDGIYMNSEVWINGHYLGKRPYGYISFQYYLTPYLKSGDNVIAVRVDNEKMPSGRWYTGAGIYRHVWLSVNEPLHVPLWGTHVQTTALEGAVAHVDAVVKVTNIAERSSVAEIKTTIEGPSGRSVGYAERRIELGGLDTAEVRFNFRINDPLVWTPDSPELYRLVTTVRKGKHTDVYTTPFGVRTISTDRHGFWLNGKNVKLKGVCLHHDGGPVGAAVPDEVLYKRLKMLKDMGANAVRTAHNPFAPEFYAMCDTIGLMVVDEPFDGWTEPKAEYDYGLYFAEWWKEDLKNFLLRDRNHPSVVMWSIGNEVPGFTEAWQREIVHFLKRYDSLRPVTQARGYEGGHVDVAGFNGTGEEVGALERYHANHPDRPILGTEMTHTLQTRGVYQARTAIRRRDFPAVWEKGQPWKGYEEKVHMTPDLTEHEVFDPVPYPYQSSFDNAYVRINVRDMEKKVRQLDYLMGTFRWTGFDYLGEAVISPARTANFGIIDLAGFPKDHYYLYQSMWSAKPMVHLLPHWTHPGKEGVELPVVVYTNMPAVELFLNGTSLGEKPANDDLQIVYHVPYTPGTLEAVAKKDGQVVARKKYTTAGAPYKTAISPDATHAVANGTDVIRFEIDVVDKAGIPVPYANIPLDFSLTGPGRIIGVENGDILDFDPVKATHRKSFHGKCLVLVQTTDAAGSIVLSVEGDGLHKTEVAVPVRRKGK